MMSAIIGRRSWLAAPMMMTLQKRSESVVFIEKDEAAQIDYSDYQSVYLIAGRARPTDEDRAKELQLVASMTSLAKPPKKLVYISSLAVEREPTPYAQTKMACEKLILSSEYGYVLRPPVIYGPGQDVNSNMLVPSIARSIVNRTPLVLKQPFQQFYLMHVDDVAFGAVMLGSIDTFLQPSMRTLNLRSNPVTPIDVISMVDQGLPLQIERGWRHTQIVTPLRQTLRTHDVTWTCAPFRVRDAVEHHVQTIQATIR